MTGYVTRFAPSPTGRLHLGHAFAALSAFQAAKDAQGLCLLRIEDIDHTRCRPEFEAGIVEDLQWLGLDWPKPVRRQSEHHSDYDAAIGRLMAAGLLYRCFRSRRDLEFASAPHGPAAAFIGGPLSEQEEAERIQAGQPFALRLSLARAAERLGGFETLSFVERGTGPQGQHGVIPITPKSAGDVVLARKDVGVAYHLAVVVDDALQGVSEVVRGEDLFEATSIQRVLQALLGLPVPTYRHHPLVRDPGGRRLAKRDRDKTLSTMRAERLDPADLRRSLGFD